MVQTKSVKLPFANDIILHKTSMSMRNFKTREHRKKVSCMVARDLISMCHLLNYYDFLAGPHGFRQKKL